MFGRNGRRGKFPDSGDSLFFFKLGFDTTGYLVTSLTPLVGLPPPFVAIDIYLEEFFASRRPLYIKNRCFSSSQLPDTLLHLAHYIRNLDYNMSKFEFRMVIQQPRLLDSFVKCAGSGMCGLRKLILNLTSFSNHATWTLSTILSQNSHTLYMFRCCGAVNFFGLWMIAHSLLSESPDYLQNFAIESKSRQLAAFKFLLDRVERFSAKRNFSLIYGDQYRTTSEVSMEEEQFLNSLFNSRLSRRPVLQIKC